MQHFLKLAIINRGDGPRLAGHGKHEEVETASYKQKDIVANLTIRAHLAQTKGRLADIVKNSITNDISDLGQLIAPHLLRFGRRFHEPEVYELGECRIHLIFREGCNKMPGGYLFDKQERPAKIFVLSIRQPCHNLGLAKGSGRQGVHKNGVQPHAAKVIENRKESDHGRRRKPEADLVVRQGSIRGQYFSE
jgi:hypothetical protein